MYGKLEQQVVTEALPRFRNVDLAGRSGLSDGVIVMHEVGPVVHHSVPRRKGLTGVKSGCRFDMGKQQEQGGSVSEPLLAAVVPPSVPQFSEACLSAGSGLATFFRGACRLASSAVDVLFPSIAPFSAMNPGEQPEEAREQLSLAPCCTRSRIGLAAVCTRSRCSIVVPMGDDDDGRPSQRTGGPVPPLSSLVALALFRRRMVCISALPYRFALQLRPKRELESAE
ncbi:unnamed protein product [Heligmosomoides polygyrus]|uniref:Uncharacterized protein n=1 Tax=Heligmosomoides polygyrus TaxID=6339 RepID=A0A183FVW4_HELPZ|nr:unnamed protein product [Heligmosomoides polygyrus]